MNIVEFVRELYNFYNYPLDLPSVNYGLYFGFNICAVILAPWLKELWEDKKLPRNKLTKLLISLFATGLFGVPIYVCWAIIKYFRAWKADAEVESIKSKFDQLTEWQQAKITAYIQRLTEEQDNEEERRT